MNKRHNPLPLLAGVKPSYLVLPHDKRFYHLTLLDFLCVRFPFVARESWQARLASGFVVWEDGSAVAAQDVFAPGRVLYYYRETSGDEEPRIPFAETVLHIDEHLIVVDKPHFLPVIPSGRFLRETLLTRLRLRPDLQHLNVADITPVHRLDKDTAGVMLLSHNPASRRAYQTMFQTQSVRKTYEALAPTRTDLAYPHDIRSRMVRGEQFYRTQEVAGEPNAFTTIELIENLGRISRYRLQPHTGKKHQLRVHMAALGMPLLNDALYPVAQAAGSEDYSKPLQLLARRIEFDDPISGEARAFESGRTLLAEQL
ncbi:pseudouridine synthase [Bergeriella denitrificans]|uniref:Pseudouridine synthase n=1 Tax=Bergeriella denitrificans TaxID=494 RepID=A0A378UGZ2_BERDE|nr:pseudouridine synthase [Bergeriella denitrificans]STZ76575.1 pseudouridine synthase [Bergeriella denitrificans]